jgi:hypothetical protein
MIPETYAISDKARSKYKNGPGHSKQSNSNTRSSSIPAATTKPSL